MSPQLACVHRCQCGAEHRCGGHPDRDCAIGAREWLCEACELDAIDDYLNRIISDTTAPAPHSHDDHKETR